MAFNETVHFNLNFFSKWSEEMAYVLGLYFTDGDLFPNYGKTNNEILYKARLYSNDKGFLENILVVMEGNPKIGHIQNSVYKKDENDKGITRGELFFFHLGKNQMLKDLYNLGMRKDKKDILFPLIPDKFKRHFIRGLFDGNGSIYIEGERAYLRAQFGHVSLNIVEAVQKELENVAGVTELAIYKNKGKKRPTHFLKYNRREDLEKLYNYLYKNSNSLCRKQERYELLYLNLLR